MRQECGEERERREGAERASKVEESAIEAGEKGGRESGRGGKRGGGERGRGGGGCRWYERNKELGKGRERVTEREQTGSSEESVR